MAAVYLHIGLRKTGTTSLQRFFFHHAEAASLGAIDYPSTPPVRNGRAHHLLAGFATPDSVDKAADLVDRIRRLSDFAEIAGLIVAEVFDHRRPKQ